LQDLLVIEMALSKPSASDISVFEDSLNSRLQSSSSKKCYVSFIRKFLKYWNLPEGNGEASGVLSIPRDFLTDFHVAKWLDDLGREIGFKPHQRKGAISAINYCNKMAGVRNIYEFKHDWTLVHKVLACWDGELKINPYVKHSASKFDIGAMFAMCELECTDSAQLLDKVIAVILMFTGMRAKDLYRVLSRDVVFVKYDGVSARHYNFYVRQTKNDMKGERRVGIYLLLNFYLC
jgi:hypothetical protein